MTLADFTARFAVPAADYYGAPDAERLRSTDPMEALLALLVEDPMDGSALGAALAKGPVELAGYAREPPSPAWLARAAECAMDGLVDAFDEGFGDPDDTTEVGQGDAAAFRAAAITFLRSLHVWTCRQTWSRVFEPDELRSIFPEEPARSR